MKISVRLLAAGTALVVGGAIAAAGAVPASAAPVFEPPDRPSARTRAAAKAAEVVAGRPAYLHASGGETFVPGAVISSGATQYVSYERRYAGIPVVGGDFVIVVNGDGRVVSTSVAMERPIGSLYVAPRLSGPRAESIAKRQLRAVTRVGDTRLVVDALGPKARLAWESTVDGTGADGPSRLTVQVDAATGKVLHTQEHVVRGQGNAGWSGPNPVPVDTRQSGGTFFLQDPTIANLPCQNAANNVTFNGPDDDWGNGDPADRETGCVDALYGAQVEARMLTQWLGRNGMDGNGGAWPIRVGLNDVNAFYDGTQVQIGHNTAGRWIGSLDVIAHEMGHGVDDHTPGGISQNGTREFVADTFGAATEWFANQPAPFDVPDFTVGEQINLDGSGPIRNMANPGALGDPNCYSSSIPDTEVHRAAGPGNHWFYLLAEGSNPTDGQPSSPTCNGSTVSGIGIRDAMRIMYEAMLQKTTASSYLRYRTWTLRAALSLFPGGCGRFNAVRAAWNAVSVPAQSDEPTCGEPTGAFEVAFEANTSNLWTVGFDNHGDWGLGMMAGTSPSIARLTNGQYLAAFQANTGNLWIAGTAGVADLQLGMMAGTSPSITRLSTGGWQAAFQANTGNLWTTGTAGTRDLGLGMLAGTSPAIATLPNGGYEIAFQANTTSLWTTGTAGTRDWGLGMMRGTSPAITGFASGRYLAAFQANTGSLWIAGTAGVADLQLGMWPGTSPAITKLTGGAWQAAFQANTGNLWTTGTAGTRDLGLGMMAGTSPAITALPNNGYQMAFQANTSALWTTGTAGTQDWGLGMHTRTSPAITS